MFFLFLSFAIVTENPVGRPAALGRKGNADVTFPEGWKFQRNMLGMTLV